MPTTKSVADDHPNMNNIIKISNHPLQDNGYSLLAGIQSANLDTKD